MVEFVAVAVILVSLLFFTICLVEHVLGWFHCLHDVQHKVLFVHIAQFRVLINIRQHSVKLFAVLEMLQLLFESVVLREYLEMGEKVDGIHNLGFLERHGVVTEERQGGVLSGDKGSREVVGDQHELFHQVITSDSLLRGITVHTTVIIHLEIVLLFREHHTPFV